MILTGKAKEEFLISNEIDEFIFCIQDKSHQYSDIIEWFDSVGIYITIEGVFDRMLGYNRGFEAHIYQDGKQSVSLFNNDDVFESRQEATKQAIIKANEIYNSL